MTTDAFAKNVVARVAARVAKETNGDEAAVRAAVEAAIAEVVRLRADNPMLGQAVKGAGPVIPVGDRTDPAWDPDPWLDDSASGPARRTADLKMDRHNRG